MSEVSRMTGVSVRTLHHYDHIGLLHPARTAENGYRYYDDASLERLRCILTYRELAFPLSDVRRLLDSPDFDRDRALTQQIRLLEMRVERLQRILDMARDIQQKGATDVSFDAFDTEKIDRYTQQAREAWGDTQAWQEYEQKSSGRSKQRSMELGQELLQVLAVFHDLQHLPDDAPSMLQQAAAVQACITEHFYTCTKPILRGLGQMYAAGGEMTENIDRFGGKGTAACAARAIAAYCDAE